MPLPADHLAYPLRRYGMDHERYAWSMLAERAPVSWPGGAKVALWVNVAVQFFPLNQSGAPFAPPGGMSTPYPDLRHFTLRDYGNRVGLFRCLDALDAFGVKPTFSVNAAMVDRCPRLIERLASRGDEILASSWHMDTLHHGGMEVAEEAALVDRALQTLREATGQPITGWLSPAGAQSGNTPDLLAARGIRYMGDWLNDELPYAFRTKSGDLTALPLSLELDDAFVIANNLHSEWGVRGTDSGRLRPFAGGSRRQGGRDDCWRCPFTRGCSDSRIASALSRQCWNIWPRKPACGPHPARKSSPRGRSSKRTRRTRRRGDAARRRATRAHSQP